MPHRHGHPRWQDRKIEEIDAQMHILDRIIYWTSELYPATADDARKGLAELEVERENVLATTQADWAADLGA